MGDSFVEDREVKCVIVLARWDLDCYSKKNLKMAKRKSTKGQTTIDKICTSNKVRVTRTQLKIWGELNCPGRVSSSCTTSGTRRIHLVRNCVLNHE